MKEEKSIGVYIIGWSVALSNIVLLLFLDYLPIVPHSFPDRIIPFLSTIAGYPLVFFRAYFSGFWMLPLFWVLFMTVSATGLLLFNKYARMVFIVLIIVHMAVLAAVVSARYGRPDFLDGFFQLYMNLVVAGAYVGFITIPEVRLQFDIRREGGSFRELFNRLRLGRHMTAAPDSHNNLGVAYMRLGRYAQAVEALEQAVTLDPDNAVYRYHMGLAHKAAKNSGKAVAALKEAVRLDPVYLDAYFELGLLYEQAGSEEQALRMFEKVSHVDPGYREVYPCLAGHYQNLGRTQKALASWQKVLDFYPDDANARFQTGVIYADHMERPQEAREAFRAAVRLDPRNVEAHIRLGKCCIQLKRYKDALRAFKDAVRADSRHLQARYQLGFTYALLKDFDSARREYRLLKERDNDLAHNLDMMIVSGAGRHM